MKDFGFDTDLAFEYENGFYLTGHPKRIGKLLAHYELYKRICNLPGEVVECGVFKGASLIRFATFRNLLESAYSRKVIGFDAFGKFPSQDEQDDSDFIQAFESEAGDGISVNELEGFLQHKGFDNFELIQGDILSTVPEYVKKHPELKVSLLHIDVDVYAPSLTILENLYPRMVSGGIIVLDDYGTVSGETRAVDEFFSDKNVSIRKLPCSHIPSYIEVQ